MPHPNGMLLKTSNRLKLRESKAGRLWSNWLYGAPGAFNPRFVRRKVLTTGKFLHA